MEGPKEPLVNDLANSIRKDGRSLAELLESSELDPEQWRVREVGRTIVLEPIGEPAGIPPGSYTPETLPPLSEGAKAILASIDAVAPLVDVRAESKGARAAPGITLEDEGLEGVRLSDEGLPGIDPDR
jgi:hypothetical protein